MAVINNLVVVVEKKHLARARSYGRASRKHHYVTREEGFVVSRWSAKEFFRWLCLTTFATYHV